MLRSPRGSPGSALRHRPRPDRRRPTPRPQRGRASSSTTSSAPVRRRGRHGRPCGRGHGLAARRRDHPAHGARCARAAAPERVRRRPRPRRAPLPGVLRGAVEQACARHLRGPRRRTPSSPGMGTTVTAVLARRPLGVRRPRRRQPLLPAARRAHPAGLRGPLARQRAAQGRRDHRRRGEAQPVQEHHHPLGRLRARGPGRPDGRSASRPATPRRVLRRALEPGGRPRDPRIVGGAPLDDAPRAARRARERARRGRQHHRDRDPGRAPGRA